MIINNQQRTLKTSVTYKANGTQTQFDFPFDYLRKAFVKVSVNDAIVDGYEIDSRSVVFYNAPAADAIITIQRETTTDRLVSWADASILKASDMTINQVQQLHILEEQQDWCRTNSVVLDENENWNMRNHRVINVANPVNPQDAVTLDYMKGYQNDFLDKHKKLVDLTTANVKKSNEIFNKTQHIAKEVNVFIPSVSSDGLISWKNAMGIPNPLPTNIKGAKGDKGDRGASGVQVAAKGHYTFYVNNSGHLICRYHNTDAPPNFVVRADGHLIYRMEMN